MTDKGPAFSALPETSAPDLSRSEYAYRALRDAVQDGRLGQGERLREKDLALWLGVSRTPVREALGRLQARGLIEFAPGRGLSVAELTKPRIVELYATREIMEGAAARFAAQHVSPAEIPGLRRLADECRDGANPAIMARKNSAFHHAIYEAARNRYLLTALGDLEDALALLRDTTFSRPGRALTAHTEHLAILDAIERRDADAAESLARAHIREAQRVRMEMLSS